MRTARPEIHPASTHPARAGTAILWMLAALLATTGGCRRDEADAAAGSTSASTAAEATGAPEEAPSSEGSEEAEADEPADEDPGDEPPTLPDVALERALGGLSFQRPVALRPWPGDEGTFAVVEQRGAAYRVAADGDEGWSKQRFLDQRERTRREHNEEGLLSLAFHPDFPDERAVFVYYAASEPRRTVLARYPVSADDPPRARPDEGETLLEVEQPWGNHNGGTILFGPDEGHLYLSYGDGGAAGDPKGNAQDLGTLLGTVVRIDPEGSSGDRPYGIPDDNPFTDDEDARDEIWAYGLRNVWRMSFDRETGRLWAADVGQDEWEEVDVLVGGGNYGWDLREGRHDFEPDNDRARPDDELIEPVAEYGHDLGESITGGRVCRGCGIEGLEGAYVYADYVSGRIWALRHDEPDASPLDADDVTANEVVAETERRIATFGRGHDGTLYVAAFDGHLYRLTAE